MKDYLDFWQQYVKIMISEATHESTLKPKESFTFNTASPEGDVVVGIGVGAETK